MKKIIVWMLVICLLSVCAACTRDNDDPTDPAVVTTDAPSNPDTPAQTEAPADPGAPESPFAAGTYELVQYEVGGVVYDGDMLTVLGLNETSLTLNADHTGKLFIGGEMDINWTDEGDITLAGIPLYTMTAVDRNTIRLVVYDVTYTLCKDGALPPTAEVTPEPADNPTDAPEATETPEVTATPVVTEAPAPGGQGGEVTIEGKIGFSTKVPVTVTLPSGNWCTTASSTAYVYNVPDESQAYSDTPRIQFEFKDSLEKINFYADSFENPQDIAGRTIGGVEMTGRTYKMYGMDWVEFYGQVTDGCWVAVKLSGVDYAAGTEADAILNSVVFGEPHA